MKKRFFLIFVLNFILASLFCEELTDFNTSWNCVLTGSPVCKPVKTSYGFTLINDARMIQSFSDSGKLLWEKSIGRGRNPQLYSLPYDFLIVFTGNNTSLKLLNPSGIQIWEKELEFTCKQLLSGRDGRFFLIGDNEICCFGITGIIKWQLTSDKISTVPAAELPDGSFIIFLDESLNNKTKGLRISPFGEILEEIIFSGIVFDSKSTDQGVLIHFTGGEVGFISISNNSEKTENKWLLKNNSSSFSKIISSDTKVAFLKQDNSGIKILELDLSDGKILSQTNAEINLKNLEIAEIIDNCIFLFDGNKCIYKTFAGQNLFSADLQKKSENDYLYSFFSNKAHLILCKENWTINAYKITEKTGDSKNFDYSKKNYARFYKNNYSEYLLFNTFSIDKSLYDSEKTKLLFNGNYGYEEKKWVSQLDFYSEQYEKHLNNKNKKSDLTVFDLDSTGVYNLLFQMSCFSSNQFCHQISAILLKTNKESDIYAALSGVSLNGYDPEREILDAIEIAALKVSPSNEKLIKKICDSVYSITFFMGRPAFNAKGKKILTLFISPAYSDKSKAYARQTLKKITELGL
ncbi:MAG: hypothetical protein MR420_06470 [Spirochaetia bacterium]|nr:hypothetical protein [Spirochaetia bacterium]